MTSRGRIYQNTSRWLLVWGEVRSKYVQSTKNKYVWRLNSEYKAVLSYISRMTKQKINTKLIDALVSGKFKRRNNLFKLEIPLKRRMSFAQNLQPTWKQKPSGKWSVRTGALKFWDNIVLVHLLSLNSVVISHSSIAVQWNCFCGW